jgi:galactose-1-phosphate uridylyltransferase
MAIPKRHISFSTEINDEELLEMKDIYKFVKNFY